MRWLSANAEPLDDDLRFTYVNDRAETLLGHSESELLSRNSWQALSVPALSELRLSSSDTAR